MLRQNFTRESNEQPDDGGLNCPQKHVDAPGICARTGIYSSTASQTKQRARTPHYWMTLAPHPS